jgi:hypothetical protein
MSGNATCSHGFCAHVLAPFAFLIARAPTNLIDEGQFGAPIIFGSTDIHRMTAVLTLKVPLSTYFGNATSISSD